MRDNRFPHGRDVHDLSGCSETTIEEIPEVVRLFYDHLARARPKNDISIMALVKGEEWYLFAFTDDYRPDVKRTFDQFAANPELSFTWHDAAVLCHRVNKE